MVIKDGGFMRGYVCLSSTRQFVFDKIVFVAAAAGCSPQIECSTARKKIRAGKVGAP